MTGERTLGLEFGRGAYPERAEPRLSWLDERAEGAASPLVRRFRARRGPARRMVDGVAALESGCRELSDAALAESATALRVALRRDGGRLEHVVRSFALVREAARRQLGMRPYDVQLLGGFALLRGMVAEMETGEGKTLAATLPACTAALAGVPVHVITVNDYLVDRDATTMGPIYRALGLTVGSIEHGMEPHHRHAAYACDVTYCSNKELTFDYLRDRIALGRASSRIHRKLEPLLDGSPAGERVLLRGLCFGIVDEADSVLVDEARTPLIISGGGGVDEFEEKIYEVALSLSRDLVPDVDYETDERERSVWLTDHGEDRLTTLASGLGGVWSGPQRRRELVVQALSATELFQRDQHYLVRDGKVQIVDEYTGRVMADRSWERGLHQMIEVKEGCELTGQIDALARISYQRFFRRYQRLAGMTGTAREVAGELHSVYGLPSVRIPTNRPVQRQDLGTEVHATLESKWRAVVARVGELRDAGRPVLIGARSVEASERLSAYLNAAGLHPRVLNARQDREEAEIIAEAGEARRITVATNMAGRGTDIVPTREALEAGGLHVIATELHEARRIDRQLYGRAGRQGDPGSHEAIVSLEDELMRAHGSSAAQRLGRAVLRDAESSRSSLARLALRRAQTRAERLHQGMRRQLLQMDDRVSQMLSFSGRGE